jgi:hypothetical protein
MDPLLSVVVGGYSWSGDHSRNEINSMEAEFAKNKINYSNARIRPQNPSRHEHQHDGLK